MSQTPNNYEAAIEQLETILEQLESNEIPLEQSIKSFEEGMNLIKFCQKILDSTEQKIHNLIQEKEK